MFTPMYPMIRYVSARCSAVGDCQTARQTAAGFSRAAELKGKHATKSRFARERATAHFARITRLPYNATARNSAHVIITCARDYFRPIDIARDIHLHHASRLSRPRDPSCSESSSRNDAFRLILFGRDAGRSGRTNT